MSVYEDIIIKDVEVLKKKIQNKWLYLSYVYIFLK